MSLFNKITGTEKDYSKIIEKKYIQSIQAVKNKNKSMMGQGKETVKGYLDSRSCYKQFIRMFIDGKPSKAFSEESRAFVGAAVKSHFFYPEISTPRKSAIENMHKHIMTITKYHSPKNTVFQVYLDLYDLLWKTEISDLIERCYNSIYDICKKGLNKKTPSNQRELVYKCSFLINGYMSLLFLLDHMTYQFATAPWFDIDEGNLYDIVLNSYHTHYKYFFHNVLVPSIDIISYFRLTDLKELEKEVFKSTALTQESWIEQRTEMNCMYGVEDITLGLVIALGVVLGLTLLLPTIRGIIYYWGCLKINLSNFYKDEAIYLSFNINRLKEELSRESDPKKIAKLESVIAKQEVACDKLKQKALKLALQYEANETQAKNNMEVDTEIENTEYHEDITPSIMI